jgi:sporulation related protein
MRALFFLLLAANIAVATLIALGGAPKGASYVPAPLNADRIRLADAGPAAAPAPPASPPAAPAAPEVKPPVCLEWGAFGPNDLPRAEAALAKLKIADRLSSRQTEEASGYWVYLPPAANRQELDKRVAELKALGVADYFVIQDPGSRWKSAISLGMFHTEDAANRHMAELQRKGVKSAVAGQRDHMVKRTVFVVREPDDAMAAKLVELKQAFPESELQSTACEPLVR